MIRRGPLLVPYDTFDKVRARLKATALDYSGKASEFYVYQETPHGVLIPRYFLDNSPLEGDNQQLTGIDTRFPRFKGNLWPEQKAGVRDAEYALRHHHGVFLNARPGAGKTVAALYIATQLRPQRVLVLVDQDNLAEQWCERIKQYVPDARISLIMPLDSQRALYKKIGLTEQPRHVFDLTGDFIICMAQTYMRHPRPIKVGMIVVDEAHVFSAPCFCQTIFNVNFNWSLALSATSERRDGNEWIFRAMLGKQVVVMRGKTEKARALFYGVDTTFLKWSDPVPNDKASWFRCVWCKWHEKMTCRYECDRCPTAKSLGTSSPQALKQTCASLYKISDYNELAVEKMLIDDPVYNAWIIETLKPFLATGRDIFVFSRLRAHLEHLQLLIELTYGNVSGLYLGNATTQAGRRSNEKALQMPVTLATYGKAGKGLDIQRKDGAIFAGPIGKHTVEQATGRIERVMEGKKHPVVVHPVIPFPTHVARMRGCLGFYRRNNYDVRIEQDLESKTRRSGGQKGG